MPVAGRPVVRIADGWTTVPASAVGGLLRDFIEHREALARRTLQLIGVQWTHRSPCEVECGVDVCHNLSGGGHCQVN